MRSALHIFGGILVLAPFTSAELAVLEPIIVSAESDFDLGKGEVFAIEEKEIRESASTNLADLLEKKAGLVIPSFFGSSGLGVPIVRGFSENASSRTLILVDGVPVVRPDLGSSPFFQFPTASLERVELLRGSRTVRYGSRALAGVISLQTGDSEGGFLELAGGSFDTVIARGRWAKEWQEWGFSIHATQNESDNFRDLASTQSQAWGFTLTSPKNDPFRSRTSWGQSVLDYQNPDGLSERMFQQNPRQSRVLVPDDFQNQVEEHRVSQNFQWDLDEHRRLEATFSHQWRERELNLGFSHPDDELRTWFGEVVYAGQEDLLSWQAGLRGQRDTLSFQTFRSASRQGDLLSIADLTVETLGGFGLVKWDFKPGWSLSGGVSYDEWSLEVDSTSLDGSAESIEDGRRREAGWAGELSLAYEKENWRWALRYDRTHRFPVTDEVASYQNFIQAEPFNFNLEPERGHSVELSGEWKGEHFNWRTTIFSSWLDGEILFDPAARLNVNFARTHRFGFENSWSYEQEHWQARLQHSATWARFRDGEFAGNDLPLVPRHTLHGAINWQPTPNLDVEASFRFVGESRDGSDFENSPAISVLPSYQLIGTKLEWKKSEAFSLYLKIDNLLDERYASLKFFDQWYPGAGRHWLVGGRWSF